MVDCRGGDERPAAVLNVTDALNAIAAAAAPDSGDAVLQAAAAAVAAASPYDLGEVVIARGGGFLRRGLAPDQPAFTADDLLAHVAQARLPVRLDQLEDAEPYPETRALLRKHGLRSLLAVPFGTPAPAGAIVIARRMGWGLVGASMHSLVPVATATGIALHHALLMTDAAGGDDSQSLARELAAVKAERDALRAEVDRLRAQVARLSVEAPSPEPSGS